MGDTRSQSGNVLFLILIAVALFAALSHAITQSNRGGGSAGISREKARLAASQILQYAEFVEQAIMRIKVINGCRDDQISFENSIVSDYVNPNAPADGRCHVFRTEGGGASFLKPPAESNDGSNYFFFGRLSFVGQSPASYSPSLDAIDLTMHLSGLNPLVCEEINSRLLATNVPIDLLHMVGDTAATRFKGIFSWSHHQHAHGRGDFNALCATNTTSASAGTPVGGLFLVKILVRR